MTINARRILKESAPLQGIHRSLLLTFRKVVSKLKRMSRFENTTRRYLRIFSLRVFTNLAQRVVVVFIAINKLVKGGWRWSVISKYKFLRKLEEKTQLLESD
jgi:hypothetical protein